ncbi:MAG: PorV/PorQ family protein [Elusimicrobiota bacterium]
MRKLFKAVLISILFFSLSFNYLSAQKIYPSAGTLSAYFLKIPLGPRPSSMAQAFASIDKDPYSFYYNPAGQLLDNKVLTLAHNRHFADFNQFFVGYGVKANLDFLPGKDKYLFFSLNYFYTSNLEERSGEYESDPFNPGPVEGNFKAGDICFSLNYAFSYSSNSLFGVGLKYINQKISDESGYSFAFDIGVIKKTKIYGKDINLGFSILNIGPGIKFISKRYDLPLTFRLGSSLYLNSLLLSFDITKYIDNYPYFSLGFENKIGKYLFIRIGYRYRLYGNELGFWSGFSTGLGFEYNRLIFDYSLNPYGDLGYSHKIGLSIKY